MQKHRLSLIIVFVLIILVGCNSYGDQEPAPTSIPLNDPQTGINDPSIPLIPPANPINLPAGFGATVYAEGLADPRMMAFGPDGSLYVTQPSTGQIIRLDDNNEDGISDTSEVVAEDLLDPSGIAFYRDGSLYTAETTRVLRLTDPDSDGYYDKREIIIAGIAAGGNTNRSIIFSPDWNHLYLAIGSSCNVCQEEDERRATVMRFKPDGSEGVIYARGLRYVIGMTFRSDKDILWVADIERDGLVKDLPPDTLYAIFKDANGGWPFCHAGRVIDPDFGNKDSCDTNLLNPVIELEAGSAPYGITFYTGDQFPEEYQKDLFIALHGNGEGSSLRGHKIVRLPLGEGEQSKRVEDFATGWVTSDGTVWGSPTDLIQGPDGSLYLSDDIHGVIYRIFYIG